MIPSFRPALAASDFAYIKRLARTGWLAPGPLAARLEAETARTLRRAAACAVSSGTAALHLALESLKLKPGSKVLVPSFACASLPHAVRHAGLEPVYMDCDPRTLNPDADHARKASRKGARALVLTHTGGYPAPVAPFRALGLPIVEDCCQAAGATIAGRPAGSFGDAAVLSFAATKPVTGGLGGMVLGSRAIAAVARDLSVYDDRDDLRPRWNYELSDLNAGLALAQWRRLGAFTARRRALARRYRAELETSAGTASVFPELAKNCEPNFFYFIVLPRDAASFIARARRAGVDCGRPVYRPLHRYAAGPRLPGADEAFKRCVTVPLYPALTDAEARTVVNRVGPILRDSRAA